MNTCCLTDKMHELIEVLHREQCSCVISTNGRLTICHQRGVKDLFKILSETPEILNSALIADKVIGKGAAALMILGKVKEVYADVISQPAIALLKSVDIPVSYGECVPNIINRAGTGICPVESLCKDAMTAPDCRSLIAEFINEMNNNTKQKIKNV